MSSPLALFEASDAHEDAQPESLATAATGTSAWLTVLALIVTTASIQVAVGVNAVLFPVVLLTAGYSNTLIGFCLAMEVLAVIIISRYIAQVIVTIGLGRVLLIATILRGASLYFIADSRDLAVWVIGVFLFGMGTSFMIIATMTWLNTIPVGRFKGAVMGAFSSALSLGTATGPVIANVVGFGGDGRALFVANMAVVAGTAIPVLLAFRQAPALKAQPRPRIGFVIRAARPVMFSSLVGGITFFGLPAFLTLFGMMNAITPENSAVLITMFMLGSIIIGPVIGTLSAYTAKSLLIGACVFVGLLCASYLPLAIYERSQALLLLFIWGGVAGGVFATGLAAVGDLFRAEDQASANVAYSLMDSLGGVIGVVLIGVAMDTFGPEGLVYVIATAAIGYFIYSLSCYQVE
jgi:MFS family permease